MSETKSFEDLFLSESKTQKNSITELKILLISDLHKNFKFLEKLKEWQIKNKENFDYIFLTGDILCLNYPENIQAEHIAIGEAEITSIISFLENMCLNVIYIGGNHDPKSLFDNTDLSLSINSKNLHKKFHKVSNDLYLFGFGGSVPTISSKNNFDSENFQPFLDIDNSTIKNVVFKGFPYQNSYEDPDYEKSDLDYYEDIKYSFDRSIKEIKEENTTENIKFLLLTHNGPFFCQSTIREYKGKCVYMGSKGLGEFINFNRNDILLNVHGHTHPSKGLYNYFNIPIINPGALVDGNLCKIELKRDCNFEWYLYSSNFLDLSN
jgi:Icc-related predicted phosphoesterase